MATLSFYYSHELSGENEHLVTAADTIIISGSVHQLQTLSSAHLALRAVKISSEEDINLIRAAASRLSPGLDDSSISELFLLPSRKVTVAALPTACSRHNSPARPHAVSSIVKFHKGGGNLNIVLIPKSRDHVLAQALAAARQFPLLTMKSRAPPNVNINIVIHLEELNIVEDDALIADIREVVDNIRLCQKLVDTPPNVFHTDAYVDLAYGIANNLKCGIEVIKGEELDKRGFGGIANVGRASSHPPALIVLSHVPPGTEDSKSICLVGKGIVYDTGGLSIKTPTTSMAGMKVDMGGSSAVLGAFVAAVKRNIPHRIHALLCVAENSVGPLSTRPDDVHVFLSGKTVEVNNTDAEGRLVLADGCYYAASSLNPSVILDMATLTGAQGITTGKYHGAIYCTDETLEQTAMKVGKLTGDLTFPLLYCPEFHRAEFRSQVADMKNSVADRSNAQSSCAAQFIGNHIESFIAHGGKWLHCDMAAPAVSGERSTGYGVALFYGLIQELVQSNK